MTKYLTEVLKEINDDIGLFKTKYQKQGDGGILGTFFAHAYIPAAKFLLPEGDPPYKPAPQPLGMTPSNMVQEIRRFYVLCRNDLKPLKREQIFIQMLENVHPDEAKILLAIKDQTLYKIYPNITAQAVADGGFIPQDVVSQIVPVTPVTVEPPKKKRGRPPKVKPSEDH